MSKKLKKVVFTILILVVIASLYKNILDNITPVKNLKYSEFISLLESKKIIQVIIDENNLIGIYANLNQQPERFKTVKPDEDPKLLERLIENKVVIDVKEPIKAPWWISILINWFPIILLIAFWIYLIRSMQGGGGRAMSFGRSKAKLVENEDKVTFEDVAGCDEAKEELGEIIEFLKNPDKFTSLGAKIPRGVMLIGRPGTGKTLLAKAVSGEAQVPFFYISGSDFVEMFVGVGASRVRDLFDQARKHAPCLIFIDEIDAVGRQRGAGLGGGNDEREQTLNQLLVEMDGFDNTKGIIIIAATNRPDVLDPALMRAGRFDRQIVVPLPDIRGREEILKVHVRRIPLADDVDLKVSARGTPYFSGADLANLVNEAALLAARRDKKTVGMDEFDESRDKVMMGPERKSAVIGEKEKKITAYHEAGHALVTKLLKNADPLHKVTIIPRGMAGGLTMQLPEEDKSYFSRSFLIDRIMISLGGRLAEEIILNEMTTGAGHDMKSLTSIARKMVCEWGMSEELGPITYGESGEHVFLGRDFGRSPNYSERVARMIDDEVKRIVTDCYEKTKAMLVENKDKLIKLAELLIEKETLTGEEVDEFIFGIKPKKKVVKEIKTVESVDKSEDTSDNDSCEEKSQNEDKSEENDDKSEEKNDDLKVYGEQET